MSDHRHRPRVAHRVRATLVAVAWLALVTACSDGDDPPAASDRSGPSSTAVTPTSGPGTPSAVPAGDGAPPEVLAEPNGWTLPGADYGNSRSHVGSGITRATVDDLEVAWTADLTGSGVYGNASTTPVVVDGVVYIQDLSSNVRAFDLESGDLVWEQPYDSLQIGPSGVAVGWGRVYAARGMDTVVALDAGTGDELWARDITATETDGIDIQPQVFAGLVLVSTVPVSLQGQYTGGDRGVLHALDVETGEVAWTFDTVESDDLWGNPEVNSGGGSWYPPAIDPEAGIVYWGIGNPAPFPGTSEFPNGSSRPGPNLYTNSLVALDVRTGELLWYQQAVEHDIFDRDLMLAMLVPTDAGTIAVGTGKLGRVIGHDPETGDVLWDTPVGRHRNDDLDELDGPTEVLPGTFGGVLTPPAHADGVVYLPVLNAPSELRPDEPAYIGTPLDVLPGEVVAVDARNGEIRWTTEIDGDPLGGTLVVGDLVFTGTSQGVLYALDRATGEVVWEHEAPGGVNGWPAAVDDTILWPVGMADPPVLLALRLPSAP